MRWAHGHDMGAAETCLLMPSFGSEVRHGDGPGWRFGICCQVHTGGGRKPGNTHTAEAGPCMDLDKEALGGRWADDRKDRFSSSLMQTGHSAVAVGL